MYLLVEKYRDHPVCAPVRLMATERPDAHEEAFKRFESVRPDRVEFFKLYELTAAGEMELASTFQFQRDVIDIEELEQLLQPVGNL